MRKILVSLLIIAGVAGLSLSVYAQNNSNNQDQVVAPGSGLQITPTRIEKQAQPGETIKITIGVTNVTQGPVTATGVVNDFVPSDDESGTPRIILDDSEETEFGLRTYVQDVPTVRLEEGEKAELSVDITVPTNATPGGHYGVVRFTSDPDSEDGGNVTLSASLGTLVLVEVAGDIHEDANLIELAAAKRGDDGTLTPGSFFQSGPLAIMSRIQNNGNTHVAPFGKIKVKNMFGNIVQELEMNQERGNVLPDSIRRFENELDNEFFFGRYTVEANLAYGEGGGNLLNQSVSFWVLPWKILLGAAVLLAAVIFGGRRAIRSYNKRVISKSRPRY